mmetsp:Transcript_51275/g.109150  ORF Transcript_51275/g.109150 Transcript_51275/m.109150 type:complete len:210 (-) Transcript_51275:145-774(-)
MMMNAASVARVFAPILSMLWASSSLSKTGLAFQVSRTRIVKHNPSIVGWQSVPNEPQDLAPSDVNYGTPLSSSHANMTATDVVQKCMDAMLQNDSPRKNSGFQVCFDFSSDRCRAALGGSVENFVAYATNPTFGSMTNANEYFVLSVGQVIAASMTRGAMQTVLVKVVPAKGDDRTFLWTMQQERRPPRQGLWLVHECIFVENAFALTF